MANKFTNREKKILLYAGLFFGLLLVAWIIFMPGKGVFDLVRVQSRLENLQDDNRRLEEENRALRQKIDKLQNDPAFLEEKARTEYGLIRENEVLYIFDKKKKQAKE